MNNTANVAIEERRKLGKFETPRNIARFIVSWAIRKADDLILDPCIGSGILFFEAIQQLERFHVSSKAFKNIYGVDIDSVAVENVMKKLGRDQSSNSNIICMDFLRTTPNKELPLVDVIICNPPYTRHQHLNQDYKKEIARGVEEKTGIELSRQSGIYVYFLLHASRFLKEKGRMAFVLPSNFLDVNYGVAVKRFLADNFRIVGIILFPKRRLLFPKVLTTTCIILLEKRQKNLVRFFRLNSLVSSPSLLRAVKNPSLLTQKTWATVNEIYQASVDPMRKWSHYFDPDIGTTQGLVPLGAIVKVKRGIATGANSFFTLSDDEVQKLEIEQKFLKPILAKARNAPFLDFTNKDFQKLRETGKKVWLLSSDLAKDKLRGTKLLRYIKQGEMEGLHHRHLTSSRRIWYSSEKRELSPIVFTYMSRQRPRFILNEGGVHVLNTFHFIYPEENSIRSGTELKALLAYLSSDKALSLLRKSGRIYGGGLLKVEPKELETLPVIDIQRLAESDTQTLANLFEQLCISARKGGGEQKIRKEIDCIVVYLQEETLKRKEEKGVMA